MVHRNSEVFPIPQAWRIFEVASLLSNPADDPIPVAHKPFHRDTMPKSETEMVLHTSHMNRLLHG